MNGYIDRILWVHLSRGTVREEEPAEGLYRDFLGGYGVGARILFDRMERGVDPLGPENIIGLVTGPLTGTPALIGSRYTMVAKSPLTGGWGDANSGGYFGPAIKFAGYDSVFIEGSSSKPVYLLLRDGQAEIRDAGAFWGMLTTDFEDSIRDEFGEDVQVVAIGPAGEQMSLISCPISNKGRAPARSGFGAVMGSKRLKAVVAVGKRQVPVAHPAELAELRRGYLKTLTGGFARMYQTYGTVGLMEGCVVAGDAPTRNWTSAAPAEEVDFSPLYADAVVARQEKRWGCWRCPLACGGEMKSEVATKHLSHKPEYETLAAFGTLCLNNDLSSIIRCNDICNAYGLDTISAGAAVGFALECYDNGLLTRDDTDGLELHWRDPAAVVALTERMARREGVGALLADGVRVAAEKIGRGAERFAMHVKGQELPMHDPKFDPGLGIVYHIEDTPARHMHGSAWAISMPEEWLRSQGIEPGDKRQYGANGETYKRLSAMTHVVNAAGICTMGWFSNDPQYIVDFLHAVTGRRYTFDDLHVVGERIANIRHAFNLREGLNPREWSIPGRAIGQPPIRKGPLGNTTIDLEADEDSYLRALGWDTRTMAPTASKLVELGLADLAKDLQVG